MEARWTCILSKIYIFLREAGCTFSEISWFIYTYIYIYISWNIVPKSSFYPIYFSLLLLLILFNNSIYFQFIKRIWQFFVGEDQCDWGLIRLSPVIVLFILFNIQLHDIIEFEIKVMYMNKIFDIYSIQHYNKFVH